MSVVTVDELTLAIKNSIDSSRGMEEEQAYMLAHHVLNFFGYSDRIIDNILEPEDRDAFYMLEDAGILTSEREETSLFDGREWRIEYWLFRRDRIATMMVRSSVDVSDTQEEESVYADLPDDIWQRGGSSE